VLEYYKNEVFIYPHYYGIPMWVAKLRLKHEDCVIGRRCKRFKVTSIGVPFNSYKENDKSYFSHFETLVGDNEKIKRFIEDLKDDPSIHNLEIQGNSIFFVNEIPAQQTIPTTHYNNKIFFIKPVVVDEKGFESWEIGSWNEEILRGFIVNLQKEHFDVKILKIQNEKLNEIYFPQVMPFLTKGQKRALELATQRGYYNFPRKIELKDLAKEAGISLSTFREHLRKAEKKIMPDLARNVRDE
jgi:predicted DNA binding protein